MSPTVLYVEDEQFDVLFMRRAFACAGLGESLKVVADGRQAIDYLAGHNAYHDRAQHPLPTVILLDLNLPLISGFDVLRWVREQPQFRALPVVIFTSSSRPEDRRKAHELGANDYMEKPGSALEFTTVAERLKERWLGLRI